MSDEKQAPKAKAKPVRPAKAPEKVYYVVNPAGTIHGVDREHARGRLRQAGWRLATAEEVAELTTRGGHQTWDDPICEPWAPEPEPEPEV